MARDAIRRGAASPSPLSSPAPSTVTAFPPRRDGSSPFIPSAAFRDVGASISASHASLSTDPVHATLSPRPMTPTAYRIDPVSPFNAAGTASLSKSADRRASNEASTPTSASRRRPLRTRPQNARSTVGSCFKICQLRRTHRPSRMMSSWITRSICCSPICCARRCFRGTAS